MKLVKNDKVSGAIPRLFHKTKAVLGVIIIEIIKIAAEHLRRAHDNSHSLKPVVPFTSGYKRDCLFVHLIENTAINCPQGTRSDY